MYFGIMSFCLLIHKIQYWSSKGLTKQWGEDIINLVLEGCLESLGVQWMLEVSRFLHREQFKFTSSKCSVVRDN